MNEQSREYYQKMYKDGYYLDENHHLIKVSNGQAYLYRSAEDCFVRDDNQFLKIDSLPLTNAQAEEKLRGWRMWGQKVRSMAGKKAAVSA